MVCPPEDESCEGIESVPGKESSRALIRGLRGGRRYVVTISTVTEPHADNANRLVSEPSDAIEVTAGLWKWLEYRLREVARTIAGSGRQDG